MVVIANETMMFGYRSSGALLGALFSFMRVAQQFTFETSKPERNTNE
jgi:hypothetical protein